MNPFITELLGTDEILKPDFDVEAFINREAEKVKEWQAYSKKWYMY